MGVGTGAKLLLVLFLGCSISAACLSRAAKWDGAGMARVQPVQTVPDQFKKWTFDREEPGESPIGLSTGALGTRPTGSWKIKAHPQAPSAPNILVQATPCPDPNCYQILLAEGLTYEYLDLTVLLRPTAEGGQASGGVVFGLKDPENFYAALVDLTAGTLEVIRVLDGKDTVLGRAPVRRKQAPWHSLRVQRNTIISKEFIQTSFDGRLAVSVEDNALGAGQIGLMTRGGSLMGFDNFHVIHLYSQRPFSPPAAY